MAVCTCSLAEIVITSWQSCSQNATTVNIIGITVFMPSLAEFRITWGVAGSVGVIGIPVSTSGIMTRRCLRQQVDPLP